MNKGLFQKHELQFIGWFAGIFLGTVAVLALFNLLPSEFEEHTGNLSILERAQLFVMGTKVDDTPTAPIQSPKVTASNTTIVKPSAHTIAAEQPTRIVIPKAEVDINILNPSSTNPEYLDKELTRGVVRYPGSGYPGAGNMFIFGHSTGYAVVQNQAYKAFNDIHSLVAGDQILVYSGTRIYTYKVRTVKKVDKNDTWVRFDGSSNMITLSTCDSFGTKADRYVVEGDYVSMANIKG